MRQWLQWVNDHREFFREWKSVQYYIKKVSGEETRRQFLIWEYDNLTEYEAYKKRRSEYKRPYAEFKQNDPYHMGVFPHSNMRVEFWEDI